MWYVCILDFDCNMLLERETISSPYFLINVVTDQMHRLIVNACHSVVNQIESCDLGPYLPDMMNMC